jgi:hypothetical protein
MPNYGYHLARAQGRVVEFMYRSLLPHIVRRQVSCVRDVPIDVFSYSGHRQLAEQVASIRSFLSNAGRPMRFVVVSDGSHSTAEMELLRRIEPCVSVEQVPAPPTNTPQVMDAYLRGHFTGKQAALLMSLPRSRPALYVDSDVLFFAGAADLERSFADLTAPAHYLQDCGFAGDARLLHSEAEKADPVNIGALLFRHPLDWTVGLTRFLELRGAPNFFTNQTLAQLTMHANGARPFDRAKYVLRLDDQFIYADRYAGPDIVLRHYVNPVRHKLWTTLSH